MGNEFFSTSTGVGPRQEEGEKDGDDEELLEEAICLQWSMAGVFGGGLDLQLLGALEKKEQRKRWTAGRLLASLTLIHQGDSSDKMGLLNT
ncbi:unnamed protein product [Urochloa humidicola]